MEFKDNLLSKKHVDQWQSNLSSLGIIGIVGGMEAFENWTSDIDYIAEGLKDISDKLVSDPSYKAVDPDNLDSMDTLIYLLGHMPSSQAFRFINLAHRHQPNISELLTVRAQWHCENRGKHRAESRVMLDRVLVSLRSRCFSLVFGQGRRGVISSILNIK